MQYMLILTRHIGNQGEEHKNSVLHIRQKKI